MSLVFWVPVKGSWRQAPWKVGAWFPWRAVWIPDSVPITGPVPSGAGAQGPGVSSSGPGPGPDPGTQTGQAGAQARKALVQGVPPRMVHLEVPRASRRPGSPPPRTTGESLGLPRGSCPRPSCCPSVSWGSGSEQAREDKSPGFPVGGQPRPESSLGQQRRAQLRGLAASRPEAQGCPAPPPPRLQSLLCLPTGRAARAQSAGKSPCPWGLAVRLGCRRLPRGRCWDTHRHLRSPRTQPQPRRCPRTGRHAAGGGRAFWRRGPPGHCDGKAPEQGASRPLGWAVGAEPVLGVCASACGEGTAR
nr:translation initiation factor IF-2 [Oryctolagus cuniculus]XP_051698389.1 translation initiation factor IF-2 [Oryctolagus cuniculus]XP_051698390.1 translation initiation factor IF-2 [Oryctolagus cuniculus]